MNTEELIRKSAKRTKSIKRIISRDRVGYSKDFSIVYYDCFIEYADGTTGYERVGFKEQ